MTVVVSGPSITATWNNKYTLTATDSTYSAGYIGVASYNCGAEFDDVIVTSVTSTTSTTSTTTPTTTSTSTTSTTSSRSSSTTSTSTSTTSSTTTGGINTMAIDGSAGAKADASSFKITGFSTSHSPDVIALAVDVGSSTAVHVSDTAGLTWTERGSAFNYVGTSYLRTYYAVASGPLSSDTITITLGTASNVGAVVFGVSGANTAAIWDSNSGLPRQARGSGVTPSTTVSTSNADDMIIGFVGDYDNGGATKAGSGFTLIPPTNEGSSQGGSNTVQVSVEYALVASTESGGALSMTIPQSNPWGIQVDAIVQTPD